MVDVRFGIMSDSRAISKKPFIEFVVTGVLPIQIICPWWFKYNCDHNGFAAIAGAKATIAHLPGVKLKQLQVAIPPIRLQEQFAAFVEQTDKSKLAIQKSLKQLETLKKALMQEYFS